MHAHSICWNVTPTIGFGNSEDVKFTNIFHILYIRSKVDVTHIHLEFLPFSSLIAHTLLAPLVGGWLVGSITICMWFDSIFYIYSLISLWKCDEMIENAENSIPNFPIRVLCRHEQFDLRFRYSACGCQNNMI